MLKVEALRTAFFGPHSFSIDPGQCLVVTGPSGSGKTVLLRAIADLDPSDGQVFLNDQHRETVSGPQWRHEVRYVAAESGWWGEAVGEHFKNHTLLLDRLNIVGLDQDMKTREIANLSTGERQRLAILRAMEGEPEVLLLDEPTSALDQKSKKQVENLIRQELARGCAVILVTHSPSQAKRFATKTLKLAGKNQAGRP
jgi:UDP-glucose/iron transport system ATP-binding protein